MLNIAVILRKSLKISFLSLIALVLFGCKNEPEARYPVQRKSGSFMKQSKERNAALVATERVMIDSLKAKHPEKEFLQSTRGFWYTIEKSVAEEIEKPKKGDVVIYEMDIYDFEGNLLYGKDELGDQVYRVDKEDTLLGFRYGIKLMKMGEKYQFYFPSVMAYGYVGDLDKIGPTTPIIVSLFLKQVIAEKDFDNP
jgi:gliding motility-associated peptidyl-prolyl isomerase